MAYVQLYLVYKHVYMYNKYLYLCIHIIHTEIYCCKLITCMSYLHISVLYNQSDNYRPMLIKYLSIATKCKLVNDFI